MTDTIEDWRPFLVRWSQEWADAQHPDAPADERYGPDEEPLRTRWLGFPPASEERIRALEERLGHRLPPSYRSFLTVSDGWRHAGGFVWLLAGTDQVRWHEDAAGLAEFFPGELDDDPTPEEELLAGMWERALQLDVESDMVYVLLDPGDVDDAGEWAVYCYASWRASPPERYASFHAFMEAMYREFHSLQVSRSERAGAVFVNATTRALDASVDAARLDALGGRYEQASAALAEAISYGRPRATGLRDQIRRLLGETYMVYFHGLTADPLYAPEVLPVLAAEHVRHHRDRTSLAHHLGGASDEVRETADEVLRQVTEGAFRYTAEGDFGRAVEEAREQARWGDTDAAWHTLRAALPEWRPVGPDHLAPFGLCGDPLLGPLITPERGRELLATPRAGQRGDAPAPAADPDPPGLAWLAEGDPGNFLVSYRFLLVESVEPAELPGRIGADDTAVLNEPMTLWDSRTRFRSNRNVSTWEDEALTAVGRAGPGWSFAFEPRPGGSFDEQRFVSPGIAASRGTRAVTVWSEPFEGHRFGVFHLSVTENGEERYAFTVRGTEVSRRGPVPAALDPDRLFPQDEPQGERLGERRALDALAAEFGIRLPRFALQHGRLHTFRTRSWSRPPGPGEAYVTLRFERHRP
ncbi:MULTISPECIES: SMI1/KNR4 family protein [Streptomyces]|uniref:SMI1/KNR4 family protein n=1 Tax=Streptomyces dengpaensis TaxID=2049881 RepID=A0ABM6T0D6_9ACTN|nr:MULTISPECIES: SMI1/KNR4 family protein [Streptomyces]AVH60372.1 SMI1/KNR4 family protein [Streptomyces dengpaensis]PIB06620.1 cell wall assembly protein [Streptomyces sp. HG99]